MDAAERALCRIVRTSLAEAARCDLVKSSRCSRVRGGLAV